MSDDKKNDSINSWDSPNINKSPAREDITKRLLREFLAKAEAAKAKKAAEAENQKHLSGISSSSKRMKMDITSNNNFGHTSVIRSTYAETQMTHIMNSWMKNNGYQLNFSNNQAQPQRDLKENVVSSTSDIINLLEPKKQKLNGFVKETWRNYTGNGFQQEEQSMPLDLGVVKNEEQNLPHDYSMNRSSVLSSKNNSLNISTLAASPVSVITNGINMPMEGNTIDEPISAKSPTPEMCATNSELKLTPRSLKKAWLDRHTTDEDDITSHFSENPQEHANSMRFNTDKTNSDFFSNGISTHDELTRGIRDVIKDCVLSDDHRLWKEIKNDMRAKNVKRLYDRNVLEKNNMVKKTIKNIIKLDKEATEILDRAKNCALNNTMYTNGSVKENKEIRSFKKLSDINDEKINVNGLNKNLNKTNKDIKKYEYTFLQDGPCFKVAPKLPKCRECRWTQNQEVEDVNNIFCRFSSFRKLRYTKNFILATAGFSDPFEDPSEDDIALWLPKEGTVTAHMDLEMSHFILQHVGNQFCDLVEQEKQAAALDVSEDGVVAWKKLVQGVREMCDVCETTLFNVHWTCSKCGFIVCLDCYKHKLNNTGKYTSDPDRDHDEFDWLLCTNRMSHELSKLMLTQIIPGDSLVLLNERMHKTRSLWNLDQNCRCRINKNNEMVVDNIKQNAIQKLLDSIDAANVYNHKIKQEPTESDDDSDISSSDSEVENISKMAFRNMLLNSGSESESKPSTPLPRVTRKKFSRIDVLNQVTSIVLSSIPVKKETVVVPRPLKHFTPRYVPDKRYEEMAPVRIMTMLESRAMYPDIPHSWLCDGKLLRLLEANHPGNYRIFQDQWKRGQPVLVSNVSDLLDMKLWHPDQFAIDFGDEKNDLINCMTGKIVPNQPMRKFWEGFEHFSKRLTDEDGYPMLLKLKDWPPGEDFAELLPTRFQDLIKALPLAEYTKRNGRLNLAGCLPDCFVRPDLGPKMYNAYGSALHPTKGTTNLHMDISDAVNIMVYVGIPKDGDDDEHIKEALRAIDEAGCDILTRRRVRCSGELPGALWHIYTAKDADKIRDLLNKIAIENGERLEPHHDPIHDQNCYLDGHLRARLYNEYGVEGYAIVQCRGDAVFIPAGAPHQVRNLHNCVKVAEDFVSPENVSHCFHLTQEFRDLSDTHTNHEDKLQIKNIIYHAVKEALACMSGSLKKEMKQEEIGNGD